MRQLLVSLALFVSLLLSVGSSAQTTDDLVRVFEASCDDICDGSAELLSFRYIPERYFYWMSEKDGRYHSMNNPILDALCAGKYRIRQVDVSHEELKPQALIDSSNTGFLGLSSFEFSTMGKREVSLFMKLDREVNHINYYLKAEYSQDNGKTWASYQQFHQKVIQDVGGDKHVYYLLNFPRSAQEKEQLMVRLFLRHNDPLDDHRVFSIDHAFVESKVFEEYAFEIKNKANLRISSTISNEIDGKDGYIELDVRGGSPPYTYEWEDGETTSTREGLSAGAYRVRVKDAKTCIEKARYVVLPPDGLESLARFDLRPSTDPKVYRLEISNLYRQPMELTFADPVDSIAVKRFEINPLYEDLRMDLDLSMLARGSYLATLSTSDFSKNVTIVVE